MSKIYQKVSKFSHMNYKFFLACYDVIPKFYQIWYTYYNEQLKHEISLMMNAQLQKLIP